MGDLNKDLVKVQPKPKKKRKVGRSVKANEKIEFQKFGFKSNFQIDLANQLAGGSKIEGKPKRVKITKNRGYQQESLFGSTKKNKKIRFEPDHIEMGNDSYQQQYNTAQNTPHTSILKGSRIKNENLRSQIHNLKKSKI